jgi:hypothetical protein
MVQSSSIKDSLLSQSIVSPEGTRKGSQGVGCNVEDMGGGSAGGGGTNGRTVTFDPRLERRSIDDIKESSMEFWSSSKA